MSRSEHLKTAAGELLRKRVAHGVPLRVRTEAPTGDAVVLVTGASSGIGAAAAERLASMGYVVLAGARKDVDLERLRALHSRVVPVRLDLADADAIEAAAALVEQRAPGGLSGLVNSAGVVVRGPLEAVSVQEWRAQFETNVFGTVALTRVLLPALRSGKGRIINISSLASRVVAPTWGPYTASKCALDAFNDTLRQELRRRGVTVSTIQPGAVRTPIWEKISADDADAFDAMPVDLRRLYDDTVSASRAFVESQAATGIPATYVADVVVHALTSPRPRLRYLVGNDARRLTLKRAIMPARMFDRAVGS